MEDHGVRCDPELSGAPWATQLTIDIRTAAPERAPARVTVTVHTVRPMQLTIDIEEHQ